MKSTIWITDQEIEKSKKLQYIPWTRPFGPLINRFKGRKFEIFSIYSIKSTIKTPNLREGKVERYKNFQYIQ